MRSRTTTGMAFTTRVYHPSPRVRYIIYVNALEFAVVECLPLKSGEMRSVLNSGHNVREVLREFMRDQRQILNLWKDDVKAQVREHLDEKYPHQDMGIVVESFEIKMARSISETRAVAQSQSHGVRV